ncbi:hypothetical protein B0H10DRAFT_2218776, partial [Mycena sp. CBHHK59/15]
QFAAPAPPIANVRRALKSPSGRPQPTSTAADSTRSTALLATPAPTPLRSWRPSSPPAHRALDLPRPRRSLSALSSLAPRLPPQHATARIQGAPGPRVHFPATSRVGRKFFVV